MAFSYTAGAVETFHVEPGEYNCVIVEAKEERSKGGNDMIAVKARVINEDGSRGVSFFERLIFTPKTFWKIDSFLAAVGRHPGEGNPIEIDCDMLIGLEFRAALIVTEFEGKKRNEVKSYILPDVDEPW